MVTVFEKFFEKNIRDIKPNAAIKIGGSTWKSDKIIISHVNVSSSIGPEAGTCSVELIQPYEHINWFNGKIKNNSDFSKIKAGEKFEVMLGYDEPSKLKKSVFTGYISAFDVEYDSNQNVKITIQGMDAKMWMMINKKTELKKNKKKYSAIVSDLFNDYSSKFKGKKINISSEASFEKEIYQRNESDFEFLSRVAYLTGSLFFVDRTGKFYFISPSVQKSNKLTIKPSGGVEYLKSSVSIWGIPKSVEVASIDEKDYQKLVKGKATSSDKVGKGNEATKLTTNIGIKSVIRIVDNTVKSTEEAKFLAESLYNQRNLGLAETTIQIVGYPETDLSTGVKIDGFDDPADNEYIIVGIEHEYSFNPRKYTTILKLKANRVTPKKRI